MLWLRTNSGAINALLGYPLASSEYMSKRIVLSESSGAENHYLVGVDVFFVNEFSLIQAIWKFTSE
jgi:hypothetical protein